MSSPSLAYLLKSLGTRAAELVQPDMLVGLGTGSTAAAMIDALGERVQGGLRFTAVATSIATADQAESLGIPVVALSDIDRLDLCIDGADEIDPNLNVVKGRGGALLYEKLVARRANDYVIISTSEKLVDRLGTRMPLPVEIVPVGWNHTASTISDLGFTPVLRQENGKPFVTDGGHYIVDCGWPELEMAPVEEAIALKALTGVVEHGIFAGMANSALIIGEDGTISERSTN